MGSRTWWWGDKELSRYIWGQASLISPHLEPVVWPLQNGQLAHSTWNHSGGIEQAAENEAAQLLMGRWNAGKYWNPFNVRRKEVSNTVVLRMWSPNQQLSLWNPV